MAISQNVPARGQECNWAIFAGIRRRKTGYKRTGITIVTCVTCAVSRHGRAGDWANGHDRGNAAIRARLLLPPRGR
jgi:hypothetical protein